MNPSRVYSVLRLSVPPEGRTITKKEWRALRFHGLPVPSDSLVRKLEGDELRLWVWSNSADAYVSSEIVVALDPKSIPGLLEEIRTAGWHENKALLDATMACHHRNRNKIVRAFSEGVLHRARGLPCGCKECRKVPSAANA
jgi:hypothetical protein